ncbi:MAG: DNA repair protein RadC [Bacteroidetes bacterium]|nr:DNA repair protein RadC [Bacteroidota bacterium]
MEKYENRFPIKHWAEDDRPREKVRLKGKNALSDAELMAILLGSGNRMESAVDLAKRILSKAGDNLIELSRMGLNELMEFNGIGEAKAITIIAALELGKRRNEAEVLAKEKITNSRDAFEIFRSTMGDQPYESFWIIMLNKANKVIRKCSISEGGVSGTVVDPKKIFKTVLDHHASSIILGHNHPSGNIQPSEADQKITRKIRDAGMMLDVAVLDHLIIGDDKYYSFADEGVL